MIVIARQWFNLVIDLLHALVFGGGMHAGGEGKPQGRTVVDNPVSQPVWR